MSTDDIGDTSGPSVNPSRADTELPLFTITPLTSLQVPVQTASWYDEQMQLDTPQVQVLKSASPSITNPLMRVHRLHSPPMSNLFLLPITTPIYLLQTVYANIQQRMASLPLHLARAHSIQP
jgi:hypothetical protein